MLKFASVVLMLSVCACSPMTRASYTPHVYTLNTENFDKLTNCFIRQSQNDAEGHEEIRVTNLEYPKEVRIADFFTQVSTGLMYEADLTENSDNTHTLTLLSWDIARKRTLRKHIIPELARCNASINLEGESH